MMTNCIKGQKLTFSLGGWRRQKVLSSTETTEWVQYIFSSSYLVKVTFDCLTLGHHSLINPATAGLKVDNNV